MAYSARLTLAALGLLVPLSLPVQAGDEVSHYIAKPSETLEEAVENFVTYNRMLRDVMARDPLNVEDMEEVHELTYTLELALAKINEEMGALPALLEEVHLSSEGDDATVLREAAAPYLARAMLLDR